MLTPLPASTPAKAVKIITISIVVYSAMIGGCIAISSFNSNNDSTSTNTDPTYAGVLHKLASGDDDLSRSERQVLNDNNKAIESHFDRMYGRR